MKCSFVIRGGVYLDYPADRLNTREHPVAGGNQRQINVESGREEGGTPGRTRASCSLARSHVSQSNNYYSSSRSN